MGYIKSRAIFEAIKDELSKPQLKRAIKVWGKSLLELERAQPTDTIEQGKWRLSDDDALRVIDEMFNVNLSSILKNFESYNFQEYYEFLKLAIDREKCEEGPKVLESFDKFSVSKFDFLSIVSFQLNMFRIPNVKETLANEVVLKDANGRPIKDAKGKIQKVTKSEEDKGKVIFTNNVTDAFSLMEYYNSLTKGTDKKPTYNFKSSSFTNIMSLYNDGINGNFELFPEREIYLYISHKSEDILNISVSKFFTSCQELYEGGGHGESHMRGLIYNVFDPNTIPAFLIFNEPYYSADGEKLVDFMPLARCLIRSKFSSTGEHQGLYFDKCYPGRMETIIHSLIEKYTTNENVNEEYHPGYGFNFDLPEEHEIRTEPYLDNLSKAYTKRIVGVNTKKLVIDGNERYTINKNNNVKEVIIKDEDFDTDILAKFPKLEIMTFQSMELTSFDPFQLLSLSNVKLSKSIIGEKFLESLSKSDINWLTIQSSKFEYESLKLFTKLKKLSLLYMPVILDKDLFDKLTNLKEFEYTKDIYNMNKELIDSLKSGGIKTKQIGI